MSDYNAGKRGLLEAEGDIVALFSFFSEKKHPEVRK